MLERLKINSNSEGNYDSEYEDEYEGEIAPEIAEDDPRRDPPPGEAPMRKPGPARGRRPAPTRAAADGPRVTKKMRDEAQEEIESLLLLGAALWGMGAPPCGEELERAAPKSAEIITRIVARNPKWLLAAREGSLILDLIALIGVLAPTGKAAYAFYSAPAGGDERGGVEFDPSRFPPFDAGLNRG